MSISLNQLYPSGNRETPVKTWGLEGWNDVNYLYFPVDDIRQMSGRESRQLRLARRYQLPSSRKLRPSEPRRAKNYVLKKHTAWRRRSTLSGACGLGCWEWQRAELIWFCQGLGWVPSGIVAELIWWCYTQWSAWPFRRWRWPGPWACWVGVYRGLRLEVGRLVWCLCYVEDTHLRDSGGIGILTGVGGRGRWRW